MFDNDCSSWEPLAVIPFFFKVILTSSNWSGGLVRQQLWDLVVFFSCFIDFSFLSVLWYTLSYCFLSVVPFVHALSLLCPHPLLPWLMPLIIKTVLRIFPHLPLFVCSLLSCHRDSHSLPSTPCGCAHCGLIFDLHCCPSCVFILFSSLWLLQARGHKHLAHFVSFVLFFPLHSFAAFSHFFCHPLLVGASLYSFTLSSPAPDASTVCVLCFITLLYVTGSWGEWIQMWMLECFVLMLCWHECCIAIIAFMHI